MMNRLCPGCGRRCYLDKQAVNPYLPNYEYIPDGEPYVFGDRVYVYGSHDRFDGSAFCMNDYVCWSAPVKALGDWWYEGVIYRKEQDPDYAPGNRMYAPDITPGPDGRYYLYYTLDMCGMMSVAVSDSFLGPFEYYGKVRWPDGQILGAQAGDPYQFDPGVLLDDDGRIWLYTGLSHSLPPEVMRRRFGKWRTDGAFCMELESDMLTVKSEPKVILPRWQDAPGTPFEAHPFFEASSIRKIGGLYYFVYSSVHQHELCYAVSEYPDRGFRPGGPIVSNGDVGLSGFTMDCAANTIGNNHGGMVKIHDQWYIFYHRQTNYHSFSRQGCAEPIAINADGSIDQVEITSCGLNAGPLRGSGRYSAAIACHLYAAAGGVHTDQVKGNEEAYPCFTQTGEDREENETQYIHNLRNGAVAGFRYFDLRHTPGISVEVKGGGGRMRVYDRIGGAQLAVIDFKAGEEYRSWQAPLSGGGARSGLFFVVETGAGVDFRSFLLTC